jgi:fatty-acyl-CoA synthase
MQDWPLLCHKVIDHAATQHGNREVISRSVEGPIHRTNYREVRSRALRAAKRLEADGMKLGDRGATLAWNTWRHLEVWYGLLGLGSIYHTVNPRLFPEQIAWIINHAGDKVLIVDASCWATLEPIRAQLKTVQHVIVMKDTPTAQIPPGAHDYEALLAAATPMERWPTLAETDAAGMCYTSGTTGHPKGAVYTHRAIFLHSMASSTTDLLGICERDVILHIVPMFHANAWCVPFAGVLNGSTQIFGGPNPQPRDIIELVHNEKVTVVGAVPTVWIAIDAILEAEPRWDISSIRCIPIGGSAAPRTLIEKFDKKYGAPMLHAWGMTEMTPLGTVCRLKSYAESLPDEERYAIRAKQGYPAIGVDMRIVNDEGVEQPWDGVSVGEIQVRGPWVIRSYYDNPESADRFTPDGWFRTGDVASIDPEGYVQITDRTKDLIKSGGEWISSIDVEVMIMGHPKVLEAAVIAVPHPKWVERPLACVVPKPGETLDPREILEYLRPRLAKWALPDDVVLIAAVPKTSVGKFDKKVLRVRFQDHFQRRASA